VAFNDLIGLIYFVFLGDLLQYRFINVFTEKLKTWLSSPLHEEKQGV